MKTNKPEVVVAFVDTNYCLHYPLPDQTDWPKLFGTKKVRLVASHGLCDELDSKKDHPTLGERASKWIKRIEPAVDAGTVEVRKETTLEIFHTPKSNESVNRSMGDASIVEQARTFARENEGVPVVVLTEDLGMRIRCRNAGLRPIKPDPATRLPDPVSDLQRQLVIARKELQDERNKKPRVRLLITGGTEESDGETSVLFKLKKPKPDTIHARIPAYLEEQKISVGEPWKSNASFDRCSVALTKWADQQQLVEDESARTIELLFSLSNLGKSPANEIEATATFDKELFVAGVSKYTIDGERIRPQAFPGLIDLHRGGYYKPTSFMKGATLVPSNLAEIRADGGYRDGIYLYRGHVVLKHYHVGHGKTVTNASFALTFKSWEDVKSFEIAVHIYGTEPPIDERYTVRVIAAVEDA